MFACQSRYPLYSVSKHGAHAFSGATALAGSVICSGDGGMRGGSESGRRNDFVCSGKELYGLCAEDGT